MITISNCTSKDCPAVAALWNAKTFDAGSCWHQVPSTSDERLSALLVDGYTIILVKNGEALEAFGLVHGSTVNALCASSQADLYRLLLEWAAQNLAQGRTVGASIVETRATNEKRWIDSLGDALAQAPYASDPATGQTVLVKATCNFQTLSDVLVARLTTMGALP